MLCTAHVTTLTSFSRRAHFKKVQTCRGTSTLPHSVLNAFSSCENYAVSRVRSTTTLSPHWCTRFLLAASTTVSVYSTGWCPEEVDRQAATRPQHSCASCIEPRQVRPTSCAMFYTSSTLPIGSGSDCASRCATANVSTAWLPDTWPSSVDLFPASTVTGFCDLLAMPPVRRSASQTFDIRRMRVRLCRTVCLERSS